MDWAPSDLVAAFLLAGALQNARRRAAVYAVLGDEPDADRTAGGDGAAAHAGAPRGCKILSCTALSPTDQGELVASNIPRRSQTFDGLDLMVWQALNNVLDM